MAKHVIPIWIFAKCKWMNILWQAQSSLTVVTSINQIKINFWRKITREIYVGTVYVDTNANARLFWSPNLSHLLCIVLQSGRNVGSVEHIYSMVKMTIVELTFTHRTVRFPVRRPRVIKDMSVNGNGLWFTPYIQRNRVRFQYKNLRSCENGPSQWENTLHM